MISLLMPYLKFDPIDKCLKQKNDLNRCIQIYKKKETCAMYLDLFTDCQKKYKKK